ncbi:hypothetical protein [Alicycliphilus denitrificans]|uniref:hypothetical protein n=1 Tax=Alicycliphilus denitrificans TaxID=179636 RepID=UPI00384B494B
MIKAEDLYKGLFSKSSNQRKTQVTTIKRLIGGLQSFRTGEIELDCKEDKTIADAIVILEQATQILQKAAKHKHADEQRQLKRLEDAHKAVNSSPFATINSVADRIAFISKVQPHTVAWLRDESKNLLFSYERSYKDCLTDIGDNIAYRPEPLNEQLEKAWYKFQDQLPSLKQQHAALILRLQELQAQAAVKP